MKMTKVLAVIASAAVAATAMATVASAASYKGNISFQTASYSFRNGWSDAGYGEATDYYDSYIVWGAGDYPEEAVQMMRKIAVSTEPIIPYRERLERAIKQRERTITDAICISVVECTLNLDNVSAIIAFTETGGTAKRISKYRPNVPIIACTENDDVLKAMSYHYGVIPVLVENIRNIGAYDNVALEIARRQKLPQGSKIIITSGMGGTIGGTNTIRVIEVL